METEEDFAPAAPPASPLPALPTLYWGSGSPPAWRPLALLVAKGIKFKSELVSFSSGVLRTPPYLALNPRGRVPIFVDGDVTMHESLAILHFIETRYPEPSFMPKDPRSMATTMLRMQEANNVSTAAGEVVYYLRRTPPESINVEYLEAKFGALHAEMKLWEDYLRGSEFIAGPGVGLTLGDFAFFPNLAYLVRLGYRLAATYPNLDAYFRRMVAQKFVIDTWPPHWKTTPGTDLLGKLYKK